MSADTPKPEANAQPQAAETKGKNAATDKPEGEAQPVPEVGGRGGADPVRFGDWEIKGRCVDF